MFICVPVVQPVVSVAARKPKVPCKAPVKKMPRSLIEAGNVRELGSGSGSPAAIRAILVQPTTPGSIHCAGDAAKSQPLSRRRIGENQECRGLVILISLVIVALRVSADFLLDHAKETPLIPVQNAFVLMDFLQVSTIEAGFVPNYIDGRCRE